MKLAILVTNTDLSDFAHRHPLDGEKFTTMVHSVRPGWDCAVFLVHQDHFPDDLGQFDGIIITGSPASVHDTDPWVGRLMDTIRFAVAQDLPIYGACYGHQAIALALGGEVGPNPHGWSFGLVRCDITDKPAWMTNLPTHHNQFAAHKEQVTRLPEGARPITQASGVACAGFAISNRIYTSQNHPEMTPAFFTALLEEYRVALGREVSDQADQSLALSDDNLVYAETIAAFFEQAIN